MPAPARLESPAPHTARPQAQSRSPPHRPSRRHAHHQQYHAHTPTSPIPTPHFHARTHTRHPRPPPRHHPHDAPAAHLPTATPTPPHHQQPCTDLMHAQQLLRERKPVSAGPGRPLSRLGDGLIDPAGERARERTRWPPAPVRGHRAVVDASVSSCCRRTVRRARLPAGRRPSAPGWR